MCFQFFVSASIYKLFVAYNVYKKIDAGAITYDQTLGESVDYQTVESCLNRMITISDNDCGVALGSLVVWSKIDALSQEEGYTHTYLNNYKADGTLYKDKKTTVSDVALLLHRLYTGDLLTQSSTDNFIALLKADELNMYLPTGLPAETVVAHKVGYLYGYAHDAGVIYGTKKNVLVVLLTGEWKDSTTQAPPVFAKLSSELWTWVEQ